MATYDPIRDQFLKIIRFHRASLLDSLEGQANPDQWHLVRRHVLRNLGDQGLEGAVMNLLESQLAGGVENGNRRK